MPAEILLPLLLQQVQFNKLRGICIAAEQGMRSLLQRLATALDEPAQAAAAAATMSQSHQTPASSAATASAAVQGSAGQRLQSAGASSTGGSSYTGAGSCRCLEIAQMHSNAVLACGYVQPIRAA
jgi:hypothetical protein